MRKRRFRNGRLSNQVVLEMENMIGERFRPGMLLPTEDKLAERFGVSRIVGGYVGTRDPGGSVR